MSSAAFSVRFRAKLWRYPGKGGWHFAPVPEKYAPPVTHGWGRTPVLAIVDGYEWRTSVWRDKRGRTLLAVPKAARGEKGDGDTVRVEIRFSVL
ncbi:MAG: DUF1905 domain-containing protein [Gemmatimonadaceae bacterium]|nr:DUF1905 domain-containing protein [Gemmatimonadaceae bacterium]